MILDNKEIYYTYELIDPRDNKVFYVGKGKNKRMYRHEQLVVNDKIPNGNIYLYNKIKKILSLELKIIYKKQLENVTEQEALDLEEYLIGYYGVKNLCNLTYGGDGYAPTDELREKLRKAHTGKYHSDKTKSIISKKNKGKKRTKEQNKRNSDTHKGKRLSNETRLKIKTAHTGKKVSLETRRKMSEAAKCRDEEKRLKVRKDRHGKQKSNYEYLIIKYGEEVAKQKMKAASDKRIETQTKVSYSYIKPLLLNYFNRDELL
jgi:hypothetical protein